MGMACQAERRIVEEDKTIFWFRDQCIMRPFIDKKRNFELFIFLS